MHCDKKTINRLKRAEGQLRGIQKMIEDEKECADIITQLSAVRSSIDRTMGIIVAENLKECLNNPAEDPEKQNQKIEQAVQLIVRK
ncbi:metal-sensitive transcriptional regulator [Fundicoccus culcitae]|uniref:Metal-sensitive transcriptional regulator n=1 Tax=Fundicoccus culcitae TaxID=2969821 RepID=A0ABY5P7R0_9LACT|nr:metal-sensitive transcriptional regulator [Fundicoccus culcitae]UUX34488.1 metal-sensitive transcriptional regulator [Fundicoccus culcitae]